MLVKSTQKFVLESPKKIREVAYLVRKLPLLIAIERLPFVAKDASKVVRKTLMTALANARNLGVSEQNLVIKEIQVNEGPRLKRFRAGSRGRAKPYKKRMSHIRVVLEGNVAKVEETAERKVESGKEAKQKADVKIGKEKKGGLTLKSLLPGKKKEAK